MAHAVAKGRYGAKFGLKRGANMRHAIVTSFRTRFVPKGFWFVRAEGSATRPGQDPCSAVSQGPKVDIGQPHAGNVAMDD